MRFVSSVLAVIVTSAVLACLIPGEPLSSFAVTLAVDKTDMPLAVGDRLTVTVTATNQSRFPRRLPACQPLGVEIQSEAGEPQWIEERFTSLAACGGREGEAQFPDTVVQPGASISSTIRLGFLPRVTRGGFETWEPGRYVIRGYLSAFGDQRTTAPIAIRLYCPPERTMC
ncbi:MAG TPA: hypothetical protein VGA37_13955 [Gemmatimonadales bacterium]